MSEPNETFRDLINEIKEACESVSQNDISPLRPLENSLRQISDNLYSTYFHFILELIQNGVDSASDLQQVRVKFHLQKTCLIVANNGAPFSERDIKRICGQSTQRKSSKKIGYKGIGFKSVARITHNPQIYSPGCQFEFNRKHHPDYDYVWLIIPHWISPDRRPHFIEPKWVTFVLPFHDDLNRDKIDELSEALNDPSPELLLFLENLEQLAIKDDYSRRAISIRKRLQPDGITVVESNHPTNQSDWEIKGRWIVTSGPPQQKISPDAVKDYESERGLRARQDYSEDIDITDTRLALAFKVDETNKFVDAEGQIFAFFPIEEKSGLRFAVQADFLTTANRETLAPASPWNKWLLSNLPDIIEDAIEKIKQYPDRRPIIYSALPMEGEAEDSFSEVVTDHLLPRLRELQIVVTDSPEHELWIRPAEAVWLDKELRSLLINDDVQYIRPNKTAFVSFAIEDKRARQFLTSSKGLEVDKLGHKEFLELLENKEWLQHKPVAWFARLFNYLGKSKLNDFHREKLRSLPLIPTKEGLSRSEDGIFLPPSEAKDELQVTGVRFVHPEILTKLETEGENFLKEVLGVKIVTQRRLITKVILPTLKERMQDLSAAVLTEYVTFVQHAYEKSEKDLDKSLREKLGKVLRFKAGDGSWRLSSELCLPCGPDGELTRAGYLLTDAPDRFLIALPPEKDRARLIKFYQWFDIPTEPPLPLLQEALSDKSWFTNKPPSWFSVLYNYLESEVDKPEFDRDLEIIPVGQTGEPGQLHSASPNLFFQTDSHEMSHWAYLLDKEEIIFVNSAIISPYEPPLPFPADPVRSKHFLEKLEITEFKPDDIIRRIIIGRFEDSAQTDEYSERLIDYTIFAFEILNDRKDFTNLPLWDEFKKAIRLQATDGSWQRPSDLYLTKAYGPYDFETLLEGIPEVHFVSDVYLSRGANNQKLTGEQKDQLRRFMVKLGIHNRLKLEVTNEWEYFDVLLLYRSEHPWRDYLSNIRDNNIDGVFKYRLRKEDDRHRIKNQATIKWLSNIIRKRNEKRLIILLNLLADLWKEYYSDHTTIIYQRWWNRHWKPEDTPSYFAWLLTHSPIIPTNRGLQSPQERIICRDIRKIRQLVGDQVDYLSFDTKQGQKQFFDFLGVIWEPEAVPKEPVIDHLRHLKDDQTTNSETVKQCADIYRHLVEIHQEIEILEDEGLVFLPTPTRNWWKPSQLFWIDLSKKFGPLRGYVSREPAYKNLFDVFEKIGVNTQSPKPKDWADCLLAIKEGNDRQIQQIIWEAYQKLENFWREEPEEPDWWMDFCDSITLLTENNGFISVKEGVYFADDQTRYRQLKEHLPFIWLSDTYRRVETFLEKVGARRISDPQWIKVDIQPGPTVKPKETRQIRAQIIANRPFIRSILAHKCPGDEPDFMPLLELLDDSSNFDVCLVESLQIELQIIAHPEIPLPWGEQSVFYKPENKTLYLLATEAENKEIVGLGAAQIFGRLEETLRSDLMLLFSKKSQDEKRDLLKHSLGIPHYEEPLEPASIIEERVEPAIKFPEESVAETYEQTELKDTEKPDVIRDTFEKEPEIKEIPYSPPPPPNNIPAGRRLRSPGTGQRKQTSHFGNQNEGDKDKRKKIGQEGEKIAREHLRDELEKAYPQAKFEENSTSFKVILNGEIVAQINWLDEDSGEMVGYDIEVVENSVTKYYEVKSTEFEENTVFQVSHAQWQCARENGDDYYIFIVYTQSRRITPIHNPYKLWQEDQLIAYSIQIEIQSGPK